MLLQDNRVGGFLDQWFQVQDLEDPLEGDQRRHDVDSHVGQRGERSVQPSEQRGQRHQLTQLECAVDDHDAAGAIDKGRGQRGDQRQRDQEDCPTQRDLDSDVANAAGPLAILVILDPGLAEQLDQQRSRDVEPLGHPSAELSVQAHGFVAEPGEALAHEPGRYQEERQQRQGRQGQRP